MELCELLSVDRGVTAIIGSGGKTTALHVLAGELSRRGTVIVCTTTHIYPPSLPLLTDPDADALSAMLADAGCVCVATPCTDGKLTAPALPFSILADAADFVLVEADGAKRLPVKAHLSHEPVIPPQARRIILIVGASGFGLPVRDAVHRADRYCELAGICSDAPVTPENLAAVLLRERLSDTILFNQCDTDAALALAVSTARVLPYRVFAGALEKREWTCIS